MNIENHPSFNALADAVGKLDADRRQDLMNVLANQADAVLTVADIAEITGVHKMTVLRWIKSGELRATRIAGYKINPIDFSMFLEGRKVKPQKAQPEQRP